MTSAVRFENILRKYYFLFRVFFLLYSTAVYTSNKYKYTLHISYTNTSYTIRIIYMGTHIY